MNPLQELHTLIEGMLFRIGNEQMNIPEHASLVLVVDGKVTQITISNEQITRVNVFVSMIDMDSEEGGK